METRRHTTRRRLVRVRLARPARSVSADLFNAVMAARAAGRDPNDEITRILDESVVFSGWLGQLIEEHADGPAFSLLADLVVQLVEVATERAEQRIALLAREYPTADS